ncbi:amino acid permease-domain-containing protein [Radiomyces spectabilis]|uniref:amino acid permease-domain-containing protein n=1 Tax=Radiomyces spectabilis TaxID=64574 RepID=UPI00221E71E3|nr:amino acid permease-domain-containing protein [Radiomyces spectabilis]KAI8371576.1 amino acid permease-domain-containing protein [Radiomyces spectabilis]
MEGSSKEQASENKTSLGNFTARYAKADPRSYLQRDDESNSHYWFRRLGHLKPVELMWSESETSGLNRVLTSWQLVFIGIGAIIGTGIFVLSGQAAAKNAGPAITISFIVAAIAAGFAAMSYSEMASMIPVAGSAYTYAYATMGEFVAWIIGWDLILEYMVGAATVGVGWSGYFVKFFAVAAKVQFGESWTKPTVEWDEKTATISYEPGHYFNVPGFVIIMLVTAVLCIGIRQSAWMNAGIVIIKLFVILLFIFALCAFVDRGNYVPYVPPNTTGNWHFFGAPGIFAAATTVFFSYIGFDAVTTAALEAKNPRRDLPIGIIGSLVISTVMYIATCTVMTGAANYELLNVPTPVTVAVDEVQRRTGRDFRWLNIIVTLGALCGLTSVLLINLLAQSRVFYAMAKDGLLPSFIGKVHPRFKTPYVATIIVGTITALLAAVLPVDLLGNMTSVGTLLAFFVVHAGVIVLRFTRPDVERRFKIPGGKYVSLLFPICGMIISVLLIAVAEPSTIWRLFIWMGVGWIIYFGYSIRRSKLHRDPVGHFSHAQTEAPETVKHDSEGLQVQEYEYVPEHHNNSHRA